MEAKEMMGGGDHGIVVVDEPAKASGG